MVRSRADIERLIRGALGEIKADLILTGAKLINVYSGEILEGTEVAVLGERICYVGPNAGHTRGEATRMFDGRGLYVSPGFTDGHTHIGYFCRPYEYLQAYVPHGTTALVATCDEQATVFGMKGVKLFLDEVEVHPLRVYTLLSMVAPQDPLLCSTESYSQSEVAEALNDPRILGLGEIVSWLRLVQRDPELLERIEMALERRKIIHGHTAGAKDQRLCAIAGAGVSSCHEPIRESDVLERMRLGYWTMLREGSFRQDLEATLKPIISRGLNTQRLILVTDSMAPDDVASQGHVDFVVRRAIELGLSPMQAIQSVTLNPAVYSGLDQDIGGIAPGRYADFVMLEDLERLEVRSTFIGGRPVAEAGNSLVENRAISLPRETRSSFRLKPTVTPSAFAVPCSLPSAKVRVIELLNLNITAEKILDFRPRGGYLEAEPERDLLKVAVFDRHGREEKAALGFLHGFGARVGAVGTTVNLDENTLLVAGMSDHDMARCANLLVESGGGMTVVDRGEVLEKIDFPIGGIFSLEPWREVGKGLEHIHRCLRERGSPFLKPIYALLFLTFVTLPSLRITARGLVAVRDRKLVPLLVERGSS